MSKPTFKMTSMKNTQAEKADLLRALHNNGKILIFPNIWDPAGALLLENTGYPAVATASAAIAFAHGYQDGEVIPLETVLPILTRIADVVDIPVTADIETGYSLDIVDFQANIKRLISTGIAGINIEDSNPKTGELLPVEMQVERLVLIRKVADEVNVPLFINARIDVYLKGSGLSADEKLNETIIRGKAYAQAGADCLFPALAKEESAIKSLVDSLPLPVNILVTTGVPEIGILKKLGVARISFGPNFMKANLLAMKILMEDLIENPVHQPITRNVIAMDFLKK